MIELINRGLVSLDANLGAGTTEVIDHLAQLVAAQGRATDADALAADARAREAKTATGVPGGIAIPHCRSAAVLEPTLAMARLAPAVDFGAKDGPADLVFFIAAPEGADQAHLKLLSKLARALVKKYFTAALRAAATEERSWSWFPRCSPTTRPRQLPPSPPLQRPPRRPAETPAESTGTPVRASRASLPSRPAPPASPTPTWPPIPWPRPPRSSASNSPVETQGSSGSTPLSQAIIDAADAVIFAVDVDVRDRSRFAGKPLIQVPVKRGIDEPAKLINDAIAAAKDPHARRVPAGTGAEETNRVHRPGNPSAADSSAPC